MINQSFIFAAALFLVVKGATLATKYAARLAESYRLSKYLVGFIVVALISILPETFISINASLKGIPSFGLGMLFGSNIADLTLVFAVIILVAERGMKIESKILKNHFVYPLILMLPLALGIDGYYSRLEGIVLIITGGVFYYAALRNGGDRPTTPLNNHPKHKSVLMLLLSMALLLIGSYFTVSSATEIAYLWGVSPILVGMLVVALGTTMPELFFSIKSMRRREDSLAVGDILGTVLTDATIVVGIMALVKPFAFPQRIIYVTGIFMVIASMILFHLMRTGKTLSRKEALLLLIFWMVFVYVEFIASF